MSFVQLNTIPAYAGQQIETLECAICEESFRKGDIAYAHAPKETNEESAPHAFHVHCLEKWLNISHTCPDCRLKISKVNGKTLDVTHSHTDSKENAEVEQLSSSDIRRLHFGFKKLREMNLSIATMDNRLDLVTAILAGGPISKNHLGIVVEMAAENGNLSIVQALLENGNISDTARGAAVVNAAKIGNLDVIQALIASGPIPMRDRKVARRSSQDENIIAAIRGAQISGNGCVIS